eukprot:jgi/Bigna1/89081/estExt_fgenesh1_pg.C_430071
MASTRGHPFWAHVLSVSAEQCGRMYEPEFFIRIFVTLRLCTLASRVRKFFGWTGISVLSTTGPRMLSQAYERFPVELRSTVRLLEVEVFNGQMDRGAKDDTASEEGSVIQDLRFACAQKSIHRNSAGWTKNSAFPYTGDHTVLGKRLPHRLIAILILEIRCRREDSQGRDCVVMVMLVRSGRCDGFGWDLLLLLLSERYSNVLQCSQRQKRSMTDTVSLRAKIAHWSHFSATHLGSLGLVQEVCKLSTNKSGLDKTTWLAVSCLTLLLGGGLLCKLELTDNLQQPSLGNQVTGAGATRLSIPPVNGNVVKGWEEKPPSQPKTPRPTEAFVANANCAKTKRKFSPPKSSRIPTLRERFVKNYFLNDVAPLRSRDRTPSSVQIAIKHLAQRGGPQQIVVIFYLSMPHVKAAIVSGGVMGDPECKAFLQLSEADKYYNKISSLKAVIYFAHDRDKDEWVIKKKYGLPRKIRILNKFFEREKVKYDVLRDDDAELVDSKTQCYSLPLRPGDQIYRHKAFGTKLLQHHAIYVGKYCLNDGKLNYLQQNSKMVAQVTGWSNAKKGVKVIIETETLESFLNGSDSFYVRRYEKRTRRRNRKETVLAALSEVGNSFCYTGVRNCESFAFWCIMATEKSFQVESMMKFLGKISLETVESRLSDSDKLRVVTNLAKASCVTGKGGKAIYGGAKIMKALKAIGGGVGVMKGLANIANIGGLAGCLVADQILGDGDLKQQVAVEVGSLAGTLAGGLATSSLVLGAAAEGTVGAAAITSGLASLGGSLVGGVLVCSGVGAALAIGGAAVAVGIKDVMFENCEDVFYEDCDLIVTVREKNANRRSTAKGFYLLAMSHALECINAVDKLARVAFIASGLASLGGSLAGGVLVHSGVGVALACNWWDCGRTWEKRHDV